MNTTRLRAIVRKEWQEAGRNRAIVWTFCGLAAMFLLLPLLFAFVFIEPIAYELGKSGDGQRLVEMLGKFSPGLLSLNPEQQAQVFVLRQFLTLLLLLPVMGAMSIATFSIVGEKAGRSLEPLLATPVTTRELLVGKGVAAAVPVVVATWGVYLAFALAIRVLGGAALLAVTFDLAAWLTVFLIGPLLAVFALGVGVLVSARAADPRSAQQVGGLVVIPLAALFIAQGAGAFLLGPAFALGGAGLLLGLDLLLLGLGARLFDRERILIRWR